MLKRLFTIGVLLVLSVACATSTPPKRRRGPKPVATSVNRQGFAVQGYDVLGYFETPAAPRKGSPKFSAQYQGATFLFANASALSQFEDAPERYAPQYGGYCAYDMALGKVVAADPTAFQIYEGGLYLLRNASVQQLWAADLKQYIHRANGVWPLKSGAIEPR